MSKVVFEMRAADQGRRQDKNDLVDAERAARRLLTGEPLPLPRTGSDASSCGCSWSSDAAPAMPASKRPTS